MPFIRHTRDKRGYDTTYVLHAYRPVRGPQQTRVLYLFRSPSHVKLGRRPLDDEAREALEHTHPDVSFDWTILGREAVPPRAEEHRERGPQRPVRHPAPAAPAPQPVRVILDDHSLLGRVAGAEQAARLRAGYADLLQRVARRARTPEDRDRLLERAHRLNPDETVDEAALREALETVEAAWAAIVGELPARRRGRRAGRGRSGGAGAPEPAPAVPPASTSELSGIIGETQPGRGGVDNAEVDVLISLPMLLATTVIAQQTPENQSTVFRLASDYYHRTVIVRDNDDKFVPDLKPEEFRVYEDGVLQKITTLFANIGGRALSGLTESRSAAPVREGLILPATRPAADTSGRLFIVFIDDLHLQAADTPRVKDVLKKVRDILVHENDLVGFVSSGKSNIAIDPSYDFGHRRFNEVINKVMGEAITVQDILGGVMTESYEGPQQMRHNTAVAQITAIETLKELSRFSDRRKAFVYVSNGYDYNPFKKSRWDIVKNMYTWMDDSGPNAEKMQQDRYNKEQGLERDPELLELDQTRWDDFKKKTEFSNADLTNQTVILAREASRNSITFYPLDPRGLMVTGSDIAIREKISYADYRDHMTQQLFTLDIIAHETGGFCICNTNDIERGLRRVDNEMSDNYELGDRTNNPDPMKLRRTVKIEVTRPGLHVVNDTSDYWLPRPQKK